MLQIQPIKGDKAFELPGGANFAVLVGAPQLTSGSEWIWSQSKTAGRNDAHYERNVLKSLRKYSAIVIRDFTLDGLDSLFRLRAFQLLSGEPRLSIPSVVFLSSDANRERMTPGFRRRVASSWPFGSLIFVADGAAAEAVSRQGLPVVAVADADRIGLDGVAALPAAMQSRADANQRIGVQVQPFWGRCGSSTAFANELDSLIDHGYFTVRIYVDDRQRFGETTRQRWAELVRENTIDSGPHLEVFAGPEGPPTDDEGNEFERLKSAVRRRTLAEIPDMSASRLAHRADVAIVNHAVNVGFVARKCPRAKIVLDTHDFLTRNAFDRARLSRDQSSFPDFSTLRRHAALEKRLWQAADVCTTVSDEETRLVRRYVNCRLVLPAPYVKPWIDPKAAAKWDLLVVADQHFFNIHSVDWFLENVVGPSARLKSMRIAIAGKVRRHLEGVWKDRLPRIDWLGFVEDLDSVRNLARLTVCPDQAGTGVSIKTLTALSAGQPLVATAVAMRGLPKAAVRDFPVCLGASEMTKDILDLLADSAKLKTRQKLGARICNGLRETNSYKTAIEAHSISSPGTRKARRSLLAEFVVLSQRCFSQPKLDAPPAALSFKQGGNADVILGEGWHDPEVWGRWMDGPRATIKLPLAWLDAPAIVEFRFADFQRPVGVTVYSGGRRLTASGLTTRRQSCRFVVDRSMRDKRTETVTLDIEAAPALGPIDLGENADGRVLGAAFESITVTRSIASFDEGAAKLAFREGGNAEPFLAEGWHEPEYWGRWMDGRQAKIRLPLALFDAPVMVEFRFADNQRPVGVSVGCRGRTLTPDGLTTQRQSCRFIVDRSMRDRRTETVTLDIEAQSAIRPIDTGVNADSRLLGAGCESIIVTRRDVHGVFALKVGGTADPFLAEGWHKPEYWGRWMDGRLARIQLPLALFDVSGLIELRFADNQRPVGIAVRCRGRTLSPQGLTTQRRSCQFIVDRSMRDKRTETVTLDIEAESAIRPIDTGVNADRRLLGAGFESIIVRRDASSERGAAEVA